LSAGRSQLRNFVMSRNKIDTKHVCVCCWCFFQRTCVYSINWTRKRVTKLGKQNDCGLIFEAFGNRNVWNWIVLRSNCWIYFDALGRGVNNTQETLVKTMSDVKKMLWTRFFITKQVSCCMVLKWLSDAILITKNAF
jgi:hypothetical protein